MTKEPTDTTSSIVTLLLDELRQSLEPKVSHILANYELFKETHNAVLQIPFVKLLLEQQRMCKCHSNNSSEEEPEEPIQLEIIDKSPIDAPNLDSIAKYINSTSGTDPNEGEQSDSSEVEADAESDEQEADAENKKNDDEDAEGVESETEVVDEAAHEEEEEAADEEAEEAADEEAEEAADEEAEEAADEEAEEAADEEEEEAADEEEAEAESEEEALELFEVEIKGKTYVTNDEMNGDIYEYDNDEVGEIIGAFKNGVAKFTKKPKSSKLK